MILTLSFVFFEVDNTKDVANTKPKGRFWKKLQGKTTSLVKTMKDHTVPKDDNKNETVKDLDTKDNHSKSDDIDSKNAVKTFFVVALMDNCTMIFKSKSFYQNIN